MKIQSITTTGVLGLADRTYDFTDATGGAARRVVVTGPTGSGKTRLLEAIVAAKEHVAPYSAGPITVRARDKSPAKIVARWVLDGGDAQRLDVAKGVIESESIFGGPLFAPRHDPKLKLLMKRYSHEPEEGKFEYVPSLRSLGVEASGSTDAHVDEQRRVRLTKTFRKYAAIPRYVSDLGLGFYGEARASAFRAAFDGLAVTVKCGGLRRTRAGVERFFVTPSGAHVLAAELSDFEQQALIFAGMASMIGLDRSAVLVDVPELHAPSGDTTRFTEALTRLGRDDQWIFATKSAEVAALPGAVVLELAAPSAQPSKEV